MIFSVLLRSFKIYKNITYIPVSESAMFSAFVGENGAGKSAVLESLDVFFNHSEWNYNHIARKRGFHEREPYICPVFLIDKAKVPKRKKKLVGLLDVMSDITWQIEEHDFNSANRKQASVFCWHRDRLNNYGVSEKSHYLFPVGIGKNSNRLDEKILSIFNNISDYDDRLKEAGYELSDALNELYDFLCSFYRYIYIPSDIDFDIYTKIEGLLFNLLWGKR